MNFYENIVIFNAALPDEDIEAASGKIKDLIANSEGEVLRAENWGRRKLAYEIKKNKKGLYMIFLFKSPAHLIKRLEDYYKVSDSVVKHLIIKLDKKHSAHVLNTLHQAEAAQKTEQMPEEQKNEA